jgi:membrane-bound lytic murein transglycosylase D
MFRTLVIVLLAGSLLFGTRAQAQVGSNNKPRAYLRTPDRLGAQALERERTTVAKVDPSPLEDERVPDVAIGVLPDVMTSDSPLAPPDKVEGKADLQWLQGFKLPDLPIRWDDRVVRFLEYFRDNPTGRIVIRNWFRRANRYADMIREKLREASLPEDLLFIAMVESNFEPTARSDVGALGMWQFVSETGEEYGLERSRWVDQRMNPERSTIAAAQLLSDLQKRFNSWELTLAAFNMGYGALSRSIVKYNTNDFWLLAQLEAGLPYETAIYVAKVMACALISRNLDRFGLGDLKPDPPISTAYVTVPGNVGLSRLARAVEISADELAALNPELRRKRTPPDVRYWSLRIPAERRALFLRKWAKMQPSAPTHRSHMLRFGERLNDVAQLYGTTLEALRRLNELEPDDNVKPGTMLLVPDVAPTQSKKDAQQAAVTVIDRTFAYTDRSRVFYRVAGQDKLDEIAKFFRVTIDEIREWNNIDPNAFLQRGMVLQLFVPREVDLGRAIVITPDDVTSLTLCSDEFFSYHEAQRDRVRIRYRIKPGDTIQRLAERFDLSPGSIGRINRFNSAVPLRADQEIVIYVPKDQAALLQQQESSP